MKDRNALLNKYDLPVPRYTSYPTVPLWQPNTLGADIWISEVRKAFSSLNTKEVSIYIHLPFCEKLCTYCGCNKKITNNHKVEDPYIQAVLTEWNMYLNWLGDTPIITEIHLGGGTPTFFSPENLKVLIQGIIEKADLAPNFQFSVEVHPVVTSHAHLETLASLGFSRLSVGIQDFDPEVQRLINRPQSFEQTRDVITYAKQVGFTSISADLIYGLPKQTRASVTNTMESVKLLRPDRISFYSYAHVPWKSPGQRLYDESDLPTGEDKRALYETGRDCLESFGYKELGMDHFALPEDALFQAAHDQSLHRNFMGYTTAPSEILIGLGASAISDIGSAFQQNEKDIKRYQQALSDGSQPYYTGHLLTHEDQKVRKQIQSLMCNLSVEHIMDSLDEDQLKELDIMETEGLLELKDHCLHVKPEGKMFLRNIAAVLDLRLRRKTHTHQPMFSKSV
jgi:oxygen-independent coproporphyrinogen III oxidase